MDPVHMEDDRDAVLMFFKAHPLWFDSTRRTVAVADWLYDLEMIFRTCHIEDRLQVSLASRCMFGDAKLWWMTIAEPAMPSRTWAHFRTLVLERYGPILNDGTGGPARDPEIYYDMFHTRYHRYVADWHAYPQESMAHYCRRFQEAILPFIPPDIYDPEFQALVILRNGVPHRLRKYVTMPAPGMSVGDLIANILRVEVVHHTIFDDEAEGAPQAPADDVGLGGPQHDIGPAPPEDPIPAVPVQEVPAHEAEDDMEVDDSDDDDFIVAPADPPADPPVIDISSDEEDEEEDPEPDPDLEHAGWIDDDEDFEDDPEEVPLDEGDDGADSDDSSVVTVEVVY